MTLKELYSKIGGDYDQAVRVLRMEKLIDKHIIDELILSDTQTSRITIQYALWRFL